MQQRYLYPILKFPTHKILIEVCCHCEKKKLLTRKRDDQHNPTSLA